MRALPDIEPYRALEEAEPGTVFETCWTNYMPLYAEARIGKVHLVSKESYPHTLCHLTIPGARLRFYPSPSDERCKRCAKRHNKKEDT